MLRTGLVDGRRASPALLTAALGVAFLFGLMVKSQTVASTGPILVLIGAVEARRRRRDVEARTASALLPAAIDQLILDLRAGQSLRQGCERLGAPAEQTTRQLPAFSGLSADLRTGASLNDAAVRLARSGDASVRLVAVTLLVLAGNGGPAVPALQRLRHTLMGVVQLKQQAASEASQSLASASLLVAAPAIFAAAVAALDPAAAELYLHEALGAVCVLASVGLSYLGWWWIQRAVAGAVVVDTLMTKTVVAGTTVTDTAGIDVR